MPSALVTTGTPPVHYLNNSTRGAHSHFESTTNARGDTGRGGASATDAALALSKLPVLGWFRDGIAVALAIIVILVNLATLVGMLHYFRTSCAREFGVLPNEPEMAVPPSLGNLTNQGGVTVISTSLIYYKANGTFTQGGKDYWAPYERTCGCDTCDLLSCSATIPIVVEYEKCNPWAEAFSLASGYIIYVNMVFAILFATVQLVMPCATKTGASRPTFWDCVIFSSGQ